MNNSLKFKVDENLPIEIADCLRHEHYDVMTIIDQGLKGVEDCSIADICRKESRIIVTLDLDFSDIRVYPPDNYSGIMVIRVKRQSRQHVINIFKQAIPLLKEEPIHQYLWIIEESRIRIRGEKE
ncbi:MAG: DUF5615 family PIN-like protein [Nitrospirota bacterium]